jgi:hypothetical protein
MLNYWNIVTAERNATIEVNLHSSYAVTEDLVAPDGHILRIYFMSNK